MIVLTTKKGNSVQPIVIIDYTRSNDIFTEDEIKSYCRQICKSLRKIRIFSLNYSYTYEHSGIQFGDAMRTSFRASILNAPNELVGLLNIQEVISSSNFDTLGNILVTRVTDSQVSFPTGAIVQRLPSGSVMTRPFTIYSTPYEPDRSHIENRLSLIGGAFDDVVFRLKVSANIDKTKSLISQVIPLFKDTGFTAKFDIPLVTLPALSKYYQPSPLNIMLQNICIDNKLTFSQTDLTFTFVTLDPNSPPKINYLKNKFTFGNSIPDTFLIGNLTFSNYAIAQIDCELFNPTMFETILVYDDSRSQIFYNLNKIANEVKTVGGQKIEAYPFYVIRYSIEESRTATLMHLTASNNWLLNNIKVDALFEAAIYKDILSA